MSDKYLIENYLLILKSTIEVYVHGTLESSNEMVKNTLNTCLNKTIESQGMTYNKMVEKGWYNKENVSENEIQKLLNNLNNN